MITTKIFWTSIFLLTFISNPSFGSSINDLDQGISSTIDLNFLFHGDCYGNVTVEFSNINRNKTKTDKCDSCYCRYFLNNQELDLHENDKIAIKACLKNNILHPACQNFSYSFKPNITKKEFIDFHTCEPLYTITMFANIYNNENITQESRSSDILNLKEDDFLLIREVEIANLEKCEIGNWGIEFSIQDKEGNELLPKLQREIDVPYLEENESYRLSFFNKSYYDWGYSRMYYLDYNDSLGRLVRFSGWVPLTTEGTYSINAHLFKRGFHVQRIKYLEESPYIPNVQINPNIELLSSNVIKVKSKNDHLMIDIGNSTFSLTNKLWCLTIIYTSLTLVSIVLSGFSIYFQYKQKKELQKQDSK